ncbi:MAG: ATP-dependent DNA helicase RecG [Acidobacteria bacterium]|nr:ATP-dependent DNA helicase RecG [Acidobacteriota bacterium]
MIGIEDSVGSLDGIGPQRTEALAACGIRTVGDLLAHIPFRYEDRSRFRPISSLKENEWALVCGEVCRAGAYRTRRRGFSIFEMLVRDDRGGIRVKLFNQPYAARLYSVGTRLVLYGQVKKDAFSKGALFFANPECEILDGKKDPSSIHSGRVVPIYRRLDGLEGRVLRRIMFAAVSRAPQELPDAVPAYLRGKLRLPSKSNALRQLHFPKLAGNGAQARERELNLLNAGLSPEHKRFIFEELFQFQAGIRMLKRHRMQCGKNRKFLLDGKVRAAIKKILPFHPTAAQKRALGEIAEDLRSEHPMSRLLQGDVGSGKTIVAAQAAVIVLENGCQAAFMAPTEILAEQHYFYMKRLFEPLGYTIDLLKGSQPVEEKKRVSLRVKSGETRIAVGTHALIQKNVEFENLALVIIDEQHRFGVLQRETLRRKGDRPDVLVMTATPIPRSLALTLYGDLDVSVIDELPPGRQPIETVWYEENRRPAIFDRIRRTVEAGYQAYIVYPLVEESEKLDLRAAIETAARLKAEIFPDLQIGLLHGRMKSREKEVVMRDFSAGKIHVLVSTTVIEVGVDVANATLMIIEHAERFGLAQLHQLRGRVGRGSAKSTCVLVGHAGDNPEIRRRLEIMCETNDGFRISEADLELRGPGEVMGTRQSGVPALQFADIVRDRRALEIASVEADRFLQLLQIRPDRECRRAAELIRRQWRDRFGAILTG